MNLINAFARNVSGIKEKDPLFLLIYQDIAPSRVKAEISACASGWLCTRVAMVIAYY